MEGIERERRLREYLETFVSEHKKRRIDQVLAWRTRFLTVVLEDIYQPHNASAVLRSCECFGIQDVHIIENYNAYEVNPDVVLGATKWLSLERYREADRDNTRRCLTGLKEKGYQLVAATPHRNDCLLDELPVDQPLAVLFGTEEKGLSDYALKEADTYVKIPMFGFTESFNISVSAALVVRELSRRLRLEGVDWGLTSEEQDTLRLAWYRRIDRGSDLLESRYWQDFKEYNTEA